jgi:hypothetical protein
METMLGQARLDTSGWRALAIMAPPALTAAPRPGVAYTVAVDTLIGYIGLSISGTSAEANAYEHATSNNSIPHVWMHGSGSTEIGFEIPISYELDCDGIYQGHGWWCGDGVARSVNCDDPNGSNIEGSIEGHVSYVNGAYGDGTSMDSKDCDPGSGSGGGGGTPRATGGGSSGTCQYYIIEMSDDGGQTWYRIGAFRICTN